MHNIHTILYLLWMCAGCHREMQCNSLLPISVLSWKYWPKSLCGQLCVWPLCVSPNTLHTYIRLFIHFTFSSLSFVYAVIWLKNKPMYFYFFRSDDEETFCRALVEYTRACSHVGYPVREWRDSFPSCSKLSLHLHILSENRLVHTWCVPLIMYI